MTTTGSTRLLTLSCTTTCYFSVVCSLFLFFPSLILWNHLLIKEPNKDLRACIYSSIFTYDIKNWQKDKDVKQLSTFQLIQIESEQHKRVWATQEDDACSHQNKFMPSHTTIPIEPQSQALSIPRWKKGRTTMAQCIQCTYSTYTSKDGIYMFHKDPNLSPQQLSPPVSTNQPWFFFHSFFFHKSRLYTLLKEKSSITDSTNHTRKCLSWNRLQLRNKMVPTGSSKLILVNHHSHKNFWLISGINTANCLPVVLFK